ncbi:PAS domain S-box-containing protein [Flavobacteriaceae bacterium MAR_2009_75]|nr:PAS domain S-box-containing protein [Flavobacteriaceae bacterium MAR_2009_75]
MPKGDHIDTNIHLIKQLPSATAFVNTDFEVVYASDKWMELYKLRRKEVVGKRIDYLFTDSNSGLANTFNDCLSKQVDKTFEEFNYDPTGKKWYEWRCNPWLDEEENVIGLILTTEDVTQQKLTETNLGRLRSKLDIISEIGKIGSWEYDIVEDKLIWCSVTKKIHETSDNFVPNIEDGISFYKEGYSKNIISMAVHDTINGGSGWSEKLQIVTAKGNEIWVRSNGTPVYDDGKLIAIRGTFQDINDKVLTETKTKANEKLLHTLIDNLPLNIYIKDTESRKILVNKAESDYLGFNDPSELLGKSNSDLYDQDIAEQLNREDQTIMDTLVPIINKESSIRDKNGKTTTFLVSKIPLLDENGRANGLVGISHDISELKQKEEKLRNLVDVASLQNKKLVNFAHIVSHNLRSHTANFSMLLEFLIDEKSEDEKKNIIRMLTNASNNLMETLENLNEVVAINTNAGLEKKPTNLNKKIETVQQNLTAFLKSHNATIINEVEENVMVKVVPAYIESILMNFMTNAVKYKDPNRKPTVELSSGYQNGMTILSIKDNGMGIDLKKYGDKLFGMYKTFHQHKDSRGIGLYITKNQIEAMKGRVVVYSEVGKGTTFKIYFNDED